jgi:glycerol kinase
MEMTDAHLMRATLEGICFQTKDVLQSMQSDTGHPTTALNVDGGMSVSDTFLQILTNLCGIPVGKHYYTHKFIIFLQPFRY